MAQNYALDLPQKDQHALPERSPPTVNMLSEIGLTQPCRPPRENTSPGVTTGRWFDYRPDGLVALRTNDYL
jgi:hypothetical protein